MSQTPATTRQAPRWRRLLQYRLVTLLLFTAAVGAGLAGYLYYSERPPTLQEIPGGMRLQEWKSYVGEQGATRRPWLVVWDRHGRMLCRGLSVNGRAFGTWTYYHNNGRPALRGFCRENCRDGVWTAWNEQGRKVAEIEHSEPAVLSEGDALGVVPMQSVVPVAQGHRGAMGLGGIADVVQSHASRRSGAARQWWANGRLRSEGEFWQDQPHGLWTYANARGENVWTGEYVHGWRLGTWHGAAAGSAGQRQIGYVLGRQVSSLDDWFAQCHQALASDDWRRRQAGVEGLALGGALALPHWIQALRSSHSDVLQFALEALTCQGREAYAALPEIDRLTQSAQLNVAHEALLAAFAVDEPHRADRFRQLLQFLKEHLDERSLHLLRRMRGLSSAALPPLEQSLEEDDAELRLLAVVILGEMFASSSTLRPAGRARADAVQELLEKAAQDHDPQVAAHAKSLLRKPPPAASGNTGMGGFF